MAWNSSTAHYSGEVADMPAVLNGLALDDRTWGGAVDAANNPLANLGSFRLTPQTLPASPTPGTVACDIVDGKTKQYVDSSTGWLVIGGAAKGDTALWYSGSGAPASGLGSNGDMYINTTTGDFYGPKSAGAWGSAAGNLKGPAGNAATVSIGTVTTGTAAVTNSGTSSAAVLNFVVPQGVKGDTGNPGTNGTNASAANPRGAWISSNDYAQFDGVSYGGSNYVALQASTHTAPKQPDTNPTYWSNIGASGLADPGSNGIVKRTALNTTGVAVAGTDFVAPSDSRLTDARTPTAHHASHQNGGSDEIATATPAANAIPKAGASGKLDAGWLPTATASGVKSIQQGSVALANSVVSATATITAVDTSKAYVVFNGSITASSNIPSILGSVALTNSTTVTGARMSGYAQGALTLYFTVVEFN